MDPSENDFPDSAPANLPSVAEVEDPLVRGLRAYLRRHNLQAFTLAAFALGTSAALWAFIYLFVYWFSLVAVTLSRSFDPATLPQITQPHLVGRDFPARFLAGAFLSLLAAGAVRRFLRPARLREARHYVLWVAVELLMAVPNATFAIWGNLAAVTRLRRREAVEAGRLLRRMDEAGGRLPLTGLSLEIGNERTLRRVLFRLQLAGLIGLREREGGWFLCLEKRDTVARLCKEGEPGGADALFL